MPAILAEPDGWPPGPAVVVVQEWWGLNGNIESFVNRLGSVGYAAVAPDLYYGAKTDEPDEAEKLAMALDEPRAIEDLRRRVSMLLDRGSTAVGVMGFCMGGGLAWEMALSDDRLSAAVPFYGGVEFGERRALMPFQSHYGTEDDFPQEMFDAIEGHVGDAPVSELHKYEGAPHAFMNDTRDAYRLEEAKVAWDRVMRFFERTLGPGVPV